ncbi:MULTISPECIES: replication-relaxation family protein [Bacillus]|uniref:replication-relaxation family protein n=1 Tax=Bacillus TaxID=1386 RepID=UPI0022E26BF7|nr:replication-relaxation family protein [Bacillus cereus group sp. TH152-1LC]HEF1854871.1 replication-relaxation family protein [Bacillus cereus]MDA1676776.1 replication-relaxation family protein [Bacillus cereus group sp. TH152-1LC]HEF1866603.1 replication-relaxation family protein [Bacillus cereus]HEF1877799.1 replication-relaxation family protein [Bacillus cereus]HEF1883834.1 replication-relaxation family protein [Bacillus cereus]
MNIQTHIKINRQMMILTSIRKLKFATRRHLMAIHDLGGIRNANRILKGLSSFVNSTVYKKEHVYYLNKKGRELFDDNEKVIPNSRLAHSLMRNEAWLYLFCPDDWQIEAPIRYKVNDRKKTIISDVKFRDDDGILNAVEIDRKQTMNINAEKMNRYGEFTVYYKNKYNGKVPIIHFFTLTSYRQKTLEQFAVQQGVYTKVHVIPEL